MPNLSSLFVSIRADDKPLNKTLAGVQASLRSVDRTKVQPKITLPAQVVQDIAGMSTKLTALARQRVSLNVDATTASADVHTLERQLDQMKRNRTSVPLSVSGEADKAIAQVEKDLLAAKRRETLIPLKLERIDARVAAVKSSLSSLERDSVNIPVEVDGDNRATGQLAQFREVVKTAFGRTVDDLDVAGKRGGSRFSEGLKGSILPGVAKLGGLMAASLGGAQVADFLRDSVTAASDLNETVSKSTAIFGENQAGIQKWASNSARSFGQSQSATLAATASLGDMFRQIGFTGDAAAKASMQTVQMAADLGSFSNLETGDVLERINAAFIGEYDSLQKVIPNISAARVQTEAMALSGTKNASALTAQQKAQAVLSIIHKDGARSAGDFARTSGGLANQQKILSAQVDDLQARIGTKLVPMLASGAVFVNKFLTEMTSGEGAGGAFADFIGRAVDVGKEFLAVAKTLAPPVKAIGSALGGTFLSSTESASTAIGGLLTVLAARKVTGFASAIVTAGTNVATSGGQFEGAGRKVAGFGKGLGTTASFLGGPWGVALGLGITALVAYATKQGEAAKQAKSFTDSLEYQKGVLTDAARESLTKQLADQGALEAALKAGVAEADYTRALLAGGSARQAMVDQLNATAVAHTRTTNTQNGTVTSTDAVGKAAESAAKQLATMGGSLDKSASASDSAGKALSGLKTETKAAEAPAVLLKQALGELAAKSTALRTETQKMLDQFTLLKSGALDQESANNAWEESIDAVRESVKENGKSLDSHSEKGRANRERVLGMIRALNDKTTADFKNTERTKGLDKATEDLSGKMKTGERRIRDAAGAAGLNAKETQKMIDKFLKTPKQVKTDITTPGMKKAQDGVDTFKRKVNDLKGKKLTADLTFKTNAGKVVVDLNKSFQLVKGGPRMTVAKGGPINHLTRRVQALAYGGPVQNFSGKGERSYDTEDAILRVNEHVWTPEEVRGAGGHKEVERLRQAAKNKRLHFADGGTVRRSVELRALSSATPSTVREVMPAAGRALSRGATNGGGGFAARVKEQLEKLIKATNDARAEMEGGGGGPIGGKGFANGLAFARRQAGKPYIWASAGPRGYDCSGFMSAIANVVQGKSPYARRFSTGQAGGQHVGGFTRGKNSAFRIGVWKNNPGHTAGTINGVNVESRSGGVHVGKSARGANNGLFNLHYGLAAGGEVKKQGDLPFDLLATNGRRYDPRVRALTEQMFDTQKLARGGLVKGGRGGVFAQVGEKRHDELVQPVPPGMNLSKQSSRVDLVAEKLDRLIAAIEANGLQGATFDFTTYNPIAEPQSVTTNKALQRIGSLGLV